MNLLIQKRPPKNANLDCADFMTMAEQELDGLPASTREWRLMTARASTRLANRVNAASLSAKFITA
jgi:hypothetical protein